jgi:hypothetical protein
MWDTLRRPERGESPTREREKAQQLEGTGSDTMLKPIEPYSSTKGTLKEEVCSRLIKSTTKAYLDNVKLLPVIFIMFTN